MTLTSLNKLNGADQIIQTYAKRLLELDNAPLYGAELGSAFGGGVEAVGKMWTVIGEWTTAYLVGLKRTENETN